MILAETFRYVDGESSSQSNTFTGLSSSTATEDIDHQAEIDKINAIARFAVSKVWLANFGKEPSLS